MGSRLLPRDLDELYAHALAVEYEAAKRLAEVERYVRAAGMEHTADELRSIAREAREQYELLAVGISGRRIPEVSPWEYAPHFLGPQARVARAPRNVREALALAIAVERRTQNFYVDVAENTTDVAMCALAVEMATDEGRHIARLERLLAREPDPAAACTASGDVLPLKP
jgi:bacterioferritin (cytochrome b1)